MEEIDQIYLDAQQEVKAGIKALPKEKAFIVLFLMYGRMSRNYKKFFLDEKENIREVYDQGLVKVWDHIFGNEEGQNYKKFEDAFLIYFEDEFSWGEIGNYSAFAAFGLVDLMKWVKCDDQESLDFVIKADFDTIHFFISMPQPNVADYEEYFEFCQNILNQEKNKILEDIAMVQNFKLNEKNLAEIKARNFPAPVSNIGF